MSGTKLAWEESGRAAVLAAGAEVEYYQRVAGRLALLQALTAALARTSSLTEVADVMIDQALPALDAEVGVVAVASEDGLWLRNIGFKGVPSDTEEAWREYPVDSPVPVAEAARIRQPIIVTTIEERNRRYPVLADVHGVEFGGAVTTFPLLVEGRLLGVMGFCFPDSREFDRDDLSFLQALADQCALAIERARLHELTLREIEVRKEAEAALREADRRKDEFIAMLAHELRNPLAPIRTAAEILRQIGSSDPRIDKIRDIVERQSTHMARIVDDLLDVSRVTRGSLLLRKERLDLVQLVRSTVNDHHSLIESAGLTVEVALPGAPVWIQADATRISQTIANLLHNSQKFTPTGGLVSVKVDLAGDGENIFINVSDTGIGMEPEVLAFAFEPFAQARQTLDRSKGGLGLGLALVRGLIELHEGSVAAHSAGLGQGSTFTIRLPLHPSEERPNKD